MRISFRKPLVLLIVTLFALGAAASSARAANTRLAPADEYFGPLKLSVLGMQNMLRDQTARVENNAADPDASYRHVALIEASVRDWEGKYPADTWLPRTLLALERLYAKIESEPSRQHASELTAWIVDKYPQSPESSLLRR